MLMKFVWISASKLLQTNVTRQSIPEGNHTQEKLEKVIRSAETKIFCTTQLLQE